MKYCSKCGSERVAFSIPEGDHAKRHNCLNCGQIFYKNPLVIVGCLPVYGDKVMLCKRGIEPRAGYWTITAGFMENDESIEQGALREAFEEAGIQPKLGRLLTAYSVPMANQVHVYFEGVLDSDQFTLTPESTDIRFFAEQDIPWEEIAFPSVVYALKRFFEDRKSGNTINTHIGMSPVMQ